MILPGNFEAFWRYDSDELHAVDFLLYLEIPKAEWIHGLPKSSYTELQYN